MKKSILTISIAILLTGCMSLKTEMVNANGVVKNCEASGGGLGLGAVVGVAIAAAARSSCVNDQKGGGFLEAENAGTLKLKFSTSDSAPLIVSESDISGIIAGDKIVSIDGKNITTPDEFQTVAFGPLDKIVEIKIARSDSELTKTASRTPFEKTKSNTK